LRAELLAVQGRLPEARRLAESGVEILRRCFSENSYALAASLYRLGKVLALQEELPQAESTLAESRELLRPLVEPDHPDLLGITQLLADVRSP
jgi:hypothetical protein